MKLNLRRHWPKHANSGSFFFRFDSAPCLLWANGWDPFQPNQGLKIFPLCRNDFPLPLTINRGGFHGLREEKLGSKNRKKPASSPVFFCSKSLSLHSLSTVLSATPSHASTSSPLTLPSPPHLSLSSESSSFSSTAAAANQHHHFRFLPSPVSAAAAPTPPQTPPPASGRLPRPLPTPRQASDSSFFSSARLPPALLRHLQLWSCMQNVNLLTVHVLQLIYNIILYPSFKQNKKFQKKFQKSFEKNYDFLKYFSTNFT